MAREMGDIDIELFLLGPIFAVGAATTLGLIDTVILGVDFSETLFTAGIVDMDLGNFLAVGSLLAVFINRDVELADTNWIDLWIVYATIGLVLAPPIFPALAETIAETPAALVAFLVQNAGFALVSYVN